MQALKTGSQMIDRTPQDLHHSIQLRVLFWGVEVGEKGQGGGGGIGELTFKGRSRQLVGGSRVVGLSRQAA